MTLGDDALDDVGVSLCCAIHDEEGCAGAASGQLVENGGRVLRVRAIVVGERHHSMGGDDTEGP